MPWEAFEDRVRAGTVPPYALVQFDAVTGDEFVRADTLELWASLRDTARSRFRAGLRAAPPPLATAVLVGLQVRYWWLVSNSRRSIDEGRLFADAAESTYLETTAVLEDAEVWRVLTAGVAHYDPFHALSNLVVLLFVGFNLERAVGWVNLVILFFGSVTGGYVLSLLLKPESASLGASGGVFGLIAAATVFGFVRSNWLPARARRYFGWVLLPYLVLMFATGWRSESVDNWAHFGGLVTGGLLGAVVVPPSSTRERWRAWLTPVLTTAGIGALLGLFAFAGPRFVPLDDAWRLANRDEQAVRAGLAAPPADRTLIWTAPASWREASLPFRNRGFGRGQAERFWSVHTYKASRVRTADEALDDALAQVRWGRLAVPPLDADAPRRSREPVEVRGEAIARVDGELGGWPSRRVTVRYGAPVDRTLVLEVVTRGRWTLEATWLTTSDRHDHLEPLRERLADGVQWLDPAPYVEAEGRWERGPGDLDRVLDYVDALRDLGRRDRAIELLDQQLERAVVEPRAVAKWLEVLADSPDALPRDRLDTRLTTFLQGQPHASVVAGVADVLDATGRQAEARGLLERAWARSPGDRLLRKARRARDLPVMLDGAQPAHLAWDPVTGDTDDRSAALRARPLTLDAASDDPAPLVDAAEAAVRAKLDAGRLDLTHLFVLRFGHPPLPGDPGRLRQELAADLRAVLDGRRPAWVSEELATALTGLSAPPDWLDTVAQHPVDGSRVVLEIGAASP